MGNRGLGGVTRSSSFQSKGSPFGCKKYDDEVRFRAKPKGHRSMQLIAIANAFFVPFAMSFFKLSRELITLIIINPFNQCREFSFVCKEWASITTQHLADIVLLRRYDSVPDAFMHCLRSDKLEQAMELINLMDPSEARGPQPCSPCQLPGWEGAADSSREWQ